MYAINGAQYMDDRNCKNRRQSLTEKDTQGTPNPHVWLSCSVRLRRCGLTWESQWGSGRRLYPTTDVHRFSRIYEGRLD